MNYKLYHDSCENLIGKLPMVDCAIIDPPYGMTTNKWDVPIPFDVLWSLLSCVKPNGAVCVFGMEPFSSKLRLSNLKMFKYDIIWSKTRATGFLNARKRPMNSHEVISVFYRKQPLYNVIKKEGEKYCKSSPNPYAKQSSCYRPFIENRTIENDGRFPTTILHMSNPYGASIKGDKRRTLHPTQKPVPLIELLVLTFTNPGDTVLDFCMGSGTTGVACGNTKRKFIGCEKDDEFFALAEQRISTAFPGPDCRVANPEVCPKNPGDLLEKGIR